MEFKVTVSARREDNAIINILSLIQLAIIENILYHIASFFYDSITLNSYYNLLHLKYKTCQEM